MARTAEFDIVVYGATGYTGKLVVEVMAKRFPAGAGLTWAIAGRDSGKLDAVAAQYGLSDAVGRIIADGADRASLDALAARARVVLTTVGPYQLYGEGLVAACANAGADYVDLCGEPAWMRGMIDRYSAAAKASGARIVFSCGFDSIPFDNGVAFLQAAAKARFGAPCVRVRGRVRKMVGTFSGGTAASLKATMAAAAQDPAIIGVLRSPFGLTPGFEGPEQPHGMAVMFDEAIGAWVAPFIMAPINTKTVHRTNALMGHSYGTDFVYDEMLVTGVGERGEAAARHVAADRSLMGADAPKPGEGPSPEERNAGHYDVLFVGETASGQKLSAVVTGDKDPGYGSTSKMIVEAAACLAQDGLAIAGGIWTPAAAMGEALTKRLSTHAGLTFTLEP